MVKYSSSAIAFVYFLQLADNDLFIFESKRQL